MNTLIILLDGAADEQVPTLGGHTPLGYFEKPFMDMVASHGVLGQTDGREYTHLFLLEFLTGKRLQTPRGLIEAIGLGVPVKPHRIAYRFSPVQMTSGSIEWAYRVSPQMGSSLQEAIVHNLDMLGDLNPRFYFYEDGRGVMTVDSDEIWDFPSPPAPIPGPVVDLGDFGEFIHKTSRDMDGLTILPWGGGALEQGEKHRCIPEAKSMDMISKSPSALGVGGLLKMRRKVVDNMWSGFQEAFRMLRSGDVLMHVEETDDISHRRAPDQKVSMLREVDDILMENLDLLIGYRVALIVDHGTSSLSGDHLRTNVPFAISEVIEPNHPTMRFCENNSQYLPLKGLAKNILS